MADYTEPVVIMTYKNKCGRVNGVSGGENISTPGGAPLRNLTYGNGEIKAEMPDLTGCGHTKPVETYEITVDIIFELTGCQKTFQIQQYANMESCCSCGDITLNYEDGKAFEVSCDRQTAFTISNNEGCELNVSVSTAGNWVKATPNSNKSKYDIVITSENGGRDSRSATITVKDVNNTTPPCATYTLTQLGKDVIMLLPFDYMTFVFRWGENDLDTATVIDAPGMTGDINGIKVGYNCAGSNNDGSVKNILEFGGDNKTGGTESACLFLGNIIKKIKDERIDIDEINIHLYARWYSTKPGNNNVNIEYYTYTGGTMHRVTDEEGKYVNGEPYENKDGSLVQQASASVTVDSGAGTACDTNAMDKVATITYNVNAGTTKFVTY